MIDLHCHLLPGIDDGPQSWEESIALAQALVADGVDVVAATPHSGGSSRSQRYSLSLLQELADDLRLRLRAAGSSLRIVVGQELSLVPDLAQRLRGGAALTYAGSPTVLLESPTDVVSEHLERAIFDLQLAGYRVLLAHPERIAQVQADPNRLLPLIHKGVYTQLTAASLTGLHGKRLRATAEALLVSGMCHVLASDAHRAEGLRAPQLRAALKAATALIGVDAALPLVQTNPQALLNGTPLSIAEPRPYRRPRRFRWLPF